MAIDSTAIREDLPVIARDGVKIGTVDRVEGEHLKLKRKDSPDHEHHYLPLTFVARAGDDAVSLSVDATECQRAFKAETDLGMQIGQRTDDPNRMAS